MSAPDLKALPVFPKCPSGISGLDQITGGGLPRGRPTLVCGRAGCGKTLFAVEFLVRGAAEFGEPGVLLAFEETGPEIAQNVTGLGFDLDRLVRERKLAIDFVRVERSEIEETGEYDLEGLFIRLGHAIDTIGAKRVVLDTPEVLFAGFSNHMILRSELRRLLRWLKDRGVTAVLTGERTDHGLTRHGLEEFVADCVILLDHRVTEQLATRRLRVVKYRGSSHGTNEYPFLIGTHGIDLLPVTSLSLDHQVSEVRVPTGIATLDEMLGGGIFRGSSVLVTGSAGTGKTSLAATAALASCRRGERCLFFSFEEAPAQLVRNLRSIGIDFQPFVDSGLLELHAVRPSLYGLEAHLSTVLTAVRDRAPEAIVLDPLTSFLSPGSTLDVQGMLLRVIDFLKARGVTAWLTGLVSEGEAVQRPALGVSSIIDTWIALQDLESGAEHNHALVVLKSRGTAHSNQTRELIFTAEGIQLVPPYIGPAGNVLTGSARIAQEAREQAESLLRDQQISRRQGSRARRLEALGAHLAMLRASFGLGAGEMRQLLDMQEDGEAPGAEPPVPAHSRKAGDGKPAPVAPAGKRAHS